MKRFLIAFAAVFTLLMAGCSSHDTAKGPTTTEASAPISAAPQPASLTCADIGGVFVAHGTDGRGDCESADPRPACHSASGEDAPNSVTEFVLTPPFPNGTVAQAMVLTQLQGGGSVPPASNASCWRIPDQAGTR